MRTALVVLLPDLLSCSFCGVAPTGTAAPSPLTPKGSLRNAMVGRTRLMPGENAV